MQQSLDNKQQLANNALNHDEDILEIKKLKWREKRLEEISSAQHQGVQSSVEISLFYLGTVEQGYVRSNAQDLIRPGWKSKLTLRWEVGKLHRPDVAHSCLRNAAVTPLNKHCTRMKKREKKCHHNK